MAAGSVKIQCQRQLGGTNVAAHLSLFISGQGLCEFEHSSRIVTVTMNPSSKKN